MRKKKPLSRRPRRAQIVADAVAVLCPFCSDAQPNRTDGSEQWLHTDFLKVADNPRVVCCSCDEPMFIFCDTKVQFNAQ